MDVATDFPSLMDDAEFLAELEKIEGAPPSRAADRASRVALATGFDTAPCPLPSPSTRPLPVNDGAPAPLAATALQRDADRWNLTPDATPDDAESAGGAASLFAAFLTILVGLSAGAAGSALIFHDRFTWLLQLWGR